MDQPSPLLEEESHIFDRNLAPNPISDTAKSCVATTEKENFEFKFEKPQISNRQSDPSIFEDADEDNDRQISGVSYVSALDMLASSAFEDGRSFSNDTYFSGIDFLGNNDYKIDVPQNVTSYASFPAAGDDSGCNTNQLSKVSHVESRMILTKKTSKALALELAGKPSSKMRPLPTNDSMKSMALVALPKSSMVKTDIREALPKYIDMRGKITTTAANETYHREDICPKKTSSCGKSSLQNFVPAIISSSEPMNTQTFVSDDDIKDVDILSGRGGKSNHHVGNKRFRQVVSEMKMMYRSTGQKTDKTALSKGIVEYVHTYGGRFLVQDGGGNDRRWREMTKAEARRKTSQALRETKVLKWTLNMPISQTETS